MPNHVILQEQKRKAINFRVAVAQGNLEGAQRYCDEYTLNSVDAKGNTALHVACEKGEKEMLAFLFEQVKIDIHKKNNACKKPLELVKDLSIDFIKKFNVKSTIRDAVFLETINAIVKQKIFFGAPNWQQDHFPEQKPTPASLWKESDPNYYRIDVLQEIMFLTIDSLKSKFKKDFNAFKIISRIIHASLAEAFQVGRCDEQVAVAFNLFLLSEERINLEWFQAGTGEEGKGQNFLVLNRNLKYLGHVDKPIVKPKAWQEGWVLDPMDSRVDKLNVATDAKLMEHLARIIAEPDIEKIKLGQCIAVRLPLRTKHHGLLISELREIKEILSSLLEQNWDEAWSKINAALSLEHNVSGDLSLQIEGQAKVWINAFFDILEAKIQVHQIKARLAINDANVELVGETQSLKLN